MNSTELMDLLVAHNAERELLQWATGKSLAQFWQQCGRGEWMLWLCDEMAGEANWPTRIKVLLVACVCADDAVFTHEKKYPNNKMPRRMLEKARAWADGRITLDELRTAIAEYRKEIDLILKMGFLSASLHNAVVAVHDAASVATGTYPGAGANAVKASIAATSLPGFLRLGRKTEYAELIRGELTVPHALKAPLPKTVSSFDSTRIQNTAIAIHEQLGPWIQAIFAELGKRGIGQEQATSQALRLAGRMEKTTEHLAPSIISLVMVRNLGSYVRCLTTERGLQHGVTPASAITISVLLASLEKDLDSLLSEEGLLQKDTVSMLATLSTRLIDIHAEEHSPIFGILASVFVVDNYARLLISRMA